ncbi:Uncharacterized membrane protein [Dethiosulfatibacter aminovorans DSM 17477]|uniref:Uncharacterized membrane protein n=1 Tax=Dethiosulfatibacter aminovorans DSM 17477 TaxID=1121476 RepID=A0A1M6GPX6_9FIRM|nr:DUF502 domain-containing protein [Dethiosulfatibacter aminovorans]SHJ12001.1 Uncharacterized membrane protein [Dethiosulfatibacter aminovorans DSM 17477]
MKNFRKWFLSGIATILPIGITVLVLIWVFNLFDGALEKPMIWILGRRIPGLGLLVFVTFVILVGMLTSNLIGRKIAQWGESLLSRIPLINIIYNPIKDVVTTLSNNKSKSFQKVALVEFPSKGIKSIGFVTNSSFTIDGEEKLSVFIPTTPNPTNGFLVIMEKSDVALLDIPVDEGIKMVVSMGSVMKENIDIFKEDIF